MKNEQVSDHCHQYCLFSQVLKNDRGPHTHVRMAFSGRTVAKTEQPAPRWPALCQGLHLPDIPSTGYESWAGHCARHFTFIYYFYIHLSIATPPCEEATDLELKPMFEQSEKPILFLKPHFASTISHNLITQTWQKPSIRKIEGGFIFI